MAGVFITKGMTLGLPVGTDLFSRSISLVAHYDVCPTWLNISMTLINDNHSHTNVVSSDSVFRIDDTGELINAPFFDIEDAYFVKTDLWLAAGIALELMDWFYGVNKGRDVIAFAPGFVDDVQRLAKATDAMRAEIVATEQFKAAMKKANARKPSS
jgi:hypothetical protein